MTLELSGVQDSVRSSTLVTLNTQPEDTALVISGTVDSVITHSGMKIGRTEKEPKLPIAFAGTLSTRAVRMSAPAECGPAAFSPAALIPHIALTLPATTLTAGYTWSDSLTVATCNGAIPISTTTVRSFQVMGEETVQGSPAILISRTDRVRAEGNGSEDQHRVELSSSGMGSARLWIRTDNGQLIQSTAGFSGFVTVIASGRRQVFKQTVAEQIDRKN